MTEKFKILANYIKDLSSETADVETYLFVKENISKYHLDIDITSKALKNKLIEVNTTLKFQDKDANEKKSYYEIVYATIIRVDDDVKEKKDLEQIIQDKNSDTEMVEMAEKDLDELKTKKINNAGSKYNKVLIWNVL